jgi:hypothetical protein
VLTNDHNKFFSTCDGGLNQGFTLSTSGIVATGPIRTSEGLCWSHTGRGNTITIETCTLSSESQIFTTLSTSAGTSFRTPDLGFCVDVFGGVSNSNAVIGLWQCNEAANQLFNPSVKAGLTLLQRLSNKMTGLCLNINNNQGAYIAGTALSQR